MESLSKELKGEVSRLTSLDLTACITEKELTEALSHFINHLIVHDFDRLIQLLYRIDISETKLKHLLREQSEIDAGEIIARLIIERQSQKIQSRKEHGSGSNVPPEDKEW